MRVKEKSLRSDQTHRLNAEDSELTVSNLIRYVTEKPMQVIGGIGFFALVYAVMTAFALYIGA